MPRRKEPRIPDAVLDQLLAGADPKTAFDPDGLIDDLKKALAERVLNAEMDHHLAGEKTVITDSGQIELAVPRDREAQSPSRPKPRRRGVPPRRSAGGQYPMVCG